MTAYYFGRAGHQAALALLLFCGVASPATAQEARPACPPGSQCVTGLSAADLLATASKLVQSGRLTDAASILDALRNLTPPQATERQFLRGMIAMGLEDYEHAIRIFRAILADQPGLQRVRLELARALFLAHHDRSADYHFRLVLADKPPPAVAANINRFLNAIRERKLWTLYAEAGIVPDSNANAAPKDDKVVLYGLPFTLSNDAQETGGVGLSVSGQFMLRPKIGKRVRLRTVLAGRHLEFFGHDLNDTYASAAVGPEVETRAGTFMPAVVYFKRWFAGAPYNGGWGARLGWEKDLNQQWSLQLDGEWRYINNDQNDGLDGPYYLLGATAQERLNGRSYLNYQATLRRQSAQDHAYAYTEPSLTLGYGREFAFGLTAYISGEAAPSFYDGFSAAFGKTRRDWRLNGSLTLIKRDWSFHGFAPVIRISYTKNLSNISFYEYKRLRSEITVTRTF